MNPICPICQKAIYDQEFVTLHKDCNSYRVTLKPWEAESMRAYNHEYLSGLSLNDLLWFHDTTWNLIKDRAVKVELPKEV